MPGAEVSSGVVALDRDIALPPRLSAEERAALVAIRTRSALRRSAVFRRCASRIDALACALEHGHPKRPAPRPERTFLRAVSWNIERGNRLDALLGFLAGEPRILAADVVLLNEVDIGMARSKNRNVAREIAEALGFEYVFGNSYVCLSHGDVRDGVHEIDNAEGLHGNAILSRWPLLRAENVGITITKDKFESSDKRLGHKKALWAEVETPLGRVAFASVHLDPYASPGQRGAQMSDALERVASRRLGLPLLLGGDLNTATYDLKNLWRLAYNVGLKLARGGVAHAVAQYMTPHEIYERPVFDALSRHGLEYLPFNDMSTGSIRYEVGTFDSESKVSEHLPPFVARVLEHQLRPWNGVTPLKVDWFAGRGLTPLRAKSRVDEGDRESLAPTTFERTRWCGEPISDHDPILVDFVAGVA